MAPSSRTSAVPIRSSRRPATSSTYPCKASNWLCSDAAWATRSWRRSPRTARCSERSRPRRKARITLVPNATTATAPAAIATMPTVLVRSCTAERIRLSAGGRGLGAYWKVTVYVWELLDRIFSPGTLSIRATTE